MHLSQQWRFNNPRRSIDNLKYSTIVYQNTKLSRSDLWKKYSEYTFVISTHGNGLDAHKDDSFQVMELTNEFYKYVSKYLKGLDKPLIYILEGGYNPKTIGSISEDIINLLIER